MSKKVIRWLLAISLLIWALARYACYDADDGGPGQDLLISRIWMEREPKDPRERIHGLYLLKKGQFGLTSFSSLYLIHLGALNWKVNGSELTLGHLQEKKIQRLRFKAFRCKDAPEPFELCLDLTDGKKTMRFYAMDREDENPDALPGMKALLEGAPTLNAAPTSEGPGDWWDEQ